MNYSAGHDQAAGGGMRQDVRRLIRHSSMYAPPFHDPS
jgi:hypothetical protein